MDRRGEALSAELRREIQLEVADQRMRAQIRALRVVAWVLIGFVNLALVIGVAVVLVTAG